MLTHTKAAEVAGLPVKRKAGQRKSRSPTDHNRDERKPRKRASGNLGTKVTRLVPF